MDRNLTRGSKGLWQRVENAIRATMPRQATVTRTTGSTVWVRFIDDGADSPESQFPSTVVNVGAGTVGWVLSLAGKKGLFVATGVFIPQTKYARTGGSITGSTAGTYVQDSESGRITFTSLNPSRQYHVSATVAVVTQGTARRNFRAVFQAIGATTVISNANAVAAELNGQLVTDTSEARLYPTAEGEITIHSAFTWISGTVAAVGFSTTATIS